MSYVPYLRSNNRHNRWAWKPETSFRTNAHGKDTANQAGDTFYHLPLLLDDASYTIIRTRKRFVEHYGTSHDPLHINMEGYDPVNIVFSGKVLDHTMLNQICGTCTNSGASSPYTHQVDDADTLDNPPETFQLWRKFYNDKGAAESKYFLYLGCYISNYTEILDKSGVLRGTLTIKAAKIIDGVDLTTPPDLPDVSTFRWGHTTISTYSKGGTAYNYEFQGYKFTYDNPRRYYKGDTDDYAVGITPADKRKVEWELTTLPMETDLYDDSQDDPTSAQNKDLTIKVARNITNDYIQYTIADAFQKIISANWDEGGRLIEVYRYSLNPHEASGTWDITIKDSYDSTRY